MLKLTVIERRNLEDLGLILLTSIIYGGAAFYQAMAISWFGNW